MYATKKHRGQAHAPCEHSESSARGGHRLLALEVYGLALAAVTVVAVLLALCLEDGSRSSCGYGILSYTDFKEGTSARDRAV